MTGKKIKLKNILSGIWAGKGLARILMNIEAENLELGGKILDIGGGKGPSYIKHLKLEEGAELVSIDLESPAGSPAKLDLETDDLPFPDSYADHALMFNVLEHLFNYNFVLSGIYRVLKQGGTLSGFVPFLVHYHPDPHDYFRYTNEALEKIFTANGYKIISLKIVGKGPYFVHFNNTAHILPVFLQFIVFPVFYFLDSAALSLRPKLAERFPLGYFFEIIKN
jgi:ubiquinone/menaquinone biosynthesis C-methylase UbiE